MKALVYNGPGKIAMEDRPKPKIQESSDAIVKMIRTTICGSDLHIIKGDVPTVPNGRVLGHEGLGVVQEVGTDVKDFKKGDRVLIACITCCSACQQCRKGMQSHCKKGGWTLGHTTDGTQAEYIKIPHANASMYPIPEGVDERQLLLFSDILPTGLEVGVLRGDVSPGKSVAIVGAGPVGLSALLAAQLYSPSSISMIDTDDRRLEVAKKMGATHTFNPGKGDLKEQTKSLHADIDGYDVVIEAVGIPATFQMCQDLVGIGGSIANIGVHGEKVDLHMETLWIRSIKITSALVDSRTIPMLLKLFASNKLDVGSLITHDFKFADMMKAYDTFSNARDTGSLKVNIEF